MPIYEVEMEDGKVYEVDAEREPTSDEVLESLGFREDTGQSRVAAFASKFPQEIARMGTAVLDIPGNLAAIAPSMKDNVLLAPGEAIRSATEEAFPINPLYADNAEQDVAGALAQGVGMLTGMKGAQALGAGAKLMSGAALGLAGAQGMSSGKETADLYDVEDPLSRAALIMGGGAQEAIIERLGGGAGGDALSKVLAGDIMTILSGKAAKAAGKTILGESAEEVAAGVIDPIKTRAIVGGFDALDSDVTVAPNGVELPALPWTAEGLKDVAWQGLMGGVGGSVFALPQYIKLKSSPKLSQAVPLYLQTKQHIDQLTAEGKEVPQELTDSFVTLDAYVQSNGAKAAVNYAAGLRDLNDPNTPPEERDAIAQSLADYETGALELAPEEVESFRAKILSNPELDSDLRDAASVADYVTADDDPTGAVLDGLQASIDQLRANPVVQAASPISPTRQEAKVAAAQAATQAAAVAPVIENAAAVGPETLAATEEVVLQNDIQNVPAEQNVLQSDIQKVPPPSTPARAANRAPFYVPPSGKGLEKIKAEAFKALRRIYGKKARGVTEGTGPGQVTFTTAAEYAATLPEGDKLRNDIENSAAEAFVHGKKGNIIVFTDRVHVYSSKNYDEVALARANGILPQSFALARLLAHEGTHPLTAAMQRQRASVAKMDSDQKKAWRDANPAHAKLLDEYEKLLEEFSTDWRQIYRAAQREPTVGQKLLRDLDVNFAAEKRRLEADVRNAKTATDRLEAQKRMADRIDLMEAMAKVEIEERFDQLSDDQVDWLFDEFLSVMSEQDMGALEKAYGKDKGFMGRLWNWLKRVFNTAIGVDPDAPVDLGRMGNFLRSAQDTLTGDENEIMGARFSSPTHILKAPPGVATSQTQSLPSWDMRKLKDSLSLVVLEGIGGPPQKKQEARKKFFDRLDKAKEKLVADPERLINPRGFIEYLRDAGVQGSVPTPPTGVGTVLNNPKEYVALLQGGYHGDKTVGKVPGKEQTEFPTLIAAKEGLDGVKEMRSLIGDGKAPPPMVVALHHLWGILSRMLPPLHQESMWLRLISHKPVLEAIQSSIDGKYALTKEQWAKLVQDARKATPTAEKFGNNATANANAFNLVLERWNGKWNDAANIYATDNSSEMGRRFWSMNQGPIGIKNKVQRFIGLTFGTPGVIMDRWKFVEFWLPSAMQEAGVRTPSEFFKYDQFNTPTDPSSIYAVYGGMENDNGPFSLALYEAMEQVLQVGINNSPDLKKVLGAHANPGGLHWFGWNAVKNEAVGHSSLDLTKDLVRNFGSDVTADQVYSQIHEQSYFTEGDEKQGERARVHLDRGVIRVERGLADGQQRTVAQPKGSGEGVREARERGATLAGGLGGGVLEDRFSTPSTDAGTDPNTKAPTEFHGRAVSPDQARRAYERLAALGSPDAKTRAEIEAAHGEIPEQARILSKWLESKGYDPIDVHRTFDAAPVRYGDDIVANVNSTRWDQLAVGAEGAILEPIADPSVVYKVFVPWEGEDTGFGIKPNMKLKDGKLLVWNYAGDIFNPIEKARFIAGIGGVPQEFHGVDPDGYLVIKMPKGTPAPDEFDSTDQRLAQEFPDPTERPEMGTPEFKAILKEERSKISEKMDLAIKAHGLRRIGIEEGVQTPRSMRGNDQNTAYLAVLDGEPYIVTDVRFENVLEDNQREIRISDAAVSRLEPKFLKQLPKLQKLVDAMVENEPGERYDARFSTPSPETELTRKKNIKVKQRDTMFTATVGGKVAGKLIVDRYAKPLAVFKVAVNEPFRRQGVATSLYQAAESAFGELVPSETYSDDAFKFWSKYRPDAVKNDLRRFRDILTGQKVEERGMTGAIKDVGRKGVVALIDGKNEGEVNSTFFTRNVDHLLPADRFSTPLAQASSSATLEDDQGRKARGNQSVGETTVRTGRRDGAGSPRDWRGKRIILTHWSRFPSLKRTDPAAHGTGGIGAEKSRKTGYPKLYLDRTYFGYGKYRREQFIGGERYTAEIDGNEIYDFTGDPLDLYPDRDAVKASGNAPFDWDAALTLYERNIRDAGYSGYRSGEYSAVALFNKVPLKKVANSDKSEPPVIGDRFSTPLSVIDNDGEYPNEKVAFFNEDSDAYIRFLLGKDDAIHITGVYAEGTDVRGSSMVQWLKKEFPKQKIIAEEVAWDAAEFWNKMQDRKLISDWNYDAFNGETKAFPEVRFSTPVASEPANANLQTDERQKPVDQGAGPGNRAGSKELPDGRGVRGSRGLLEESGRPLAPGEPLRGLEGKAANIPIPGRGTVTFGPFEKAREVARKYMESAGLPYDPPTTYAKVDPARAKRIADEYEKMAHDPTDPEVAAAYRAMIDETIAQWNAIMETGLKVEPMPPGEDPYAATPRMAVLDVIENNHMWFFPTNQGFGSGDKISDNPLESTKTGVVLNGMELVANDMFRVVHDYFGHIKEGVGFRADGEENAWRSHSAMYSPLARKAMTTETRGQNSWLNFGPHGEKNRTAQTAETVFAPQKIGLLPQWVVEEAAGDRFSTPEQDREYLAAVERGDMEEAQRLVDEAAKRAGYDIGPTYHGSGTPGITVFEKKVPPTSKFYLDVGIHFGPIETANQYARYAEEFPELRSRDFASGKTGSTATVYPVYLKSSNILDLTNTATRPERESGKKGPIPDDLKHKIIEIAGLSQRSKFVELSDVDPMGLVGVAGKKDNRALRRAFISHGYDGVAYNWQGKNYLVFSPNQIKSADPVTRDAQGNVIPLSKRFDKASNDIRFSTPLPASAGRYDRTSWTDNDVAEWMKEANEAKYNELVEFATTMGTKTQTKYLREGVAVMTDFVRRELATIVEDGENEIKLDPVTGEMIELPPLDDAHVLEYVKLAKKMLKNKTFARKFKDRFQKHHADTVEAQVNRRKSTSAIDAETGQLETITQEWLENKDYAVHKGSAVVAVLQLELMNIAQRLALSLDTKGKRPGTPEYNRELRKLELMQLLMPAANDTIIGDYMTIRDAARSLQVRSMAVAGKGFWRAIKLIDRARREAAMETGKRDGMTSKQVEDLIRTLSSEMNLDVIPEIVRGNLVYDKVEELLQAALDNKAAQMAAAEQEEQDWWTQAVKTFTDEERDLLDAFKLLMEDIAHDAKLIGEIPGLGKSSTPDPGAERSHEDIVKGLVEKRARAMSLLKKLVQVQTKNAARISKELRKKILTEKRLALLKPDPQAQKLIDQYMNAPVVKARANEKNPTKDAFIKQIKNPVPDEEFVLELQKLGMSKETAYNLAAVARDQIEERRERDDAVGAARAARAEERRVAEDFERFQKEVAKLQADEAKLIEKIRKDQERARERDAEALAKGLEQARKAAAAAEAKQRKADLRALEKLEKEREAAQKKLDKLANIPTDIANAIIEKIDEEKTEWLAPDAKRAPEVQRLKRAALVDARTARGVVGGITRERFISDYAADFRKAGVADLAANTLATRLYEENLKLASNREMAKRSRMVNSRKFLEALIKDIYATSISAKGSGTYAEEQAVDAFRAAGLTEADAKQAASALSLAVRQAQQKAQMEALERAAKKLKMKNPTIEALKQAIRSGLFNPADPVASALARLSGFKELSMEDYKRLAEADDMTRGTSSEAAKGQSIMLAIMRKSDPPKRIRDMIYSAWVPDAISGLSNYMLNLTSPVFTTLRANGLRVVEIMLDAGRGKTDFTQAASRLGSLVSSLQRGMREMVDQMRFAAVHDAYKNRMAEHIRNMDALLGQGEKAVTIFREGVKDKNPAKILGGAVRWVYSTVNLIRRSFSTIDQAWAAGLARQTFEYEAYRELFSNAKITPAEAAVMMAEADTAAQNGLNAKINARDAAGANPMDNVTQNVVKHDLFRQALLTQMRDRFGVENADQMAVGSDKDADMELGNRDSESAPNWDVFNNLIEMVKRGALAMRKDTSSEQKSGPFVTALSHMLTGFISVPANVLNRSFYFTPIGIFRAKSKLKEFNNDELTSHYNETMSTRRQAETRMLEGAIGTILMVAYMALKLAGDDEDDEKSWGFDINGAGPKDPKLKEAWLKKGHRQNSLELRTPWGMASVPWGRGGFEGVSMAMLPLAAVKDMRLNGVDPAKAENVGRYAGAMMNAFASQAKFFGAKSSAQGLISTDQQALGMATYSLSPFLPYSGLTKSIVKALGEDSPMERSSPSTAFWASTPVAGVAGTVRLNAFGDQMEDLTWMNRSWFAGVPLAFHSGDSPSNDDLYSYVLRTGIAPAIPSRGNLERANGAVSDEKWMEYAKIRGQILKTEMRRELHRILFMDRKDAENAVEKLGADATKEAKKKMGLK